MGSKRNEFDFQHVDLGTAMEHCSRVIWSRDTENIGLEANDTGLSHPHGGNS